MVQLRSVTLEGDAYDPAGTLTGGSKSSSGSILARFHESCQLQAIIERQTDAVQLIEEELRNIRKLARQNADLEKQIKLKQHAADLVKEQLERTTQSQVR